jgi:haloalkane dehalogenase
MSVAHARRFQVDAGEYPFEDHWLDRDGVAMHYVDQGRGVPVLMLHGNPTWSFLYRKVIRELSPACRCIAPDYPGFGYSDHPPGYGYTPPEHASWVGTLLDRLGLDRFVLVVQDWGGPIGMSLAVDRPEQVAGLVICNTWCWPPDMAARIFSLLMGGARLGRHLQLEKNFFARRIVASGIVRPEIKTPAVLAAYTDPFPTPDSRMGTWVFPRSIRAQSAWLRSLEEKLPVLRDKPVEMVFAMKDVAFGKESCIRRWHRHFPEAPVDRLSDASHYLQEDRPDRVAAAVRRVLARIGAHPADEASARPGPAGTPSA